MEVTRKERKNIVLSSCKFVSKNAKIVEFIANVDGDKIGRVLKNFCIHKFSIKTHHNQNFASNDSMMTILDDHQYSFSLQQVRVALELLQLLAGALCFAHYCHRC